MKDRVISSSYASDVKIRHILYASETLERTYDTLRCRGQAAVEGGPSRSIVYSYKVDGSGAVSVDYELEALPPATPTPVPSPTPIPTPTPIPLSQGELNNEWFRRACPYGVGVRTHKAEGDIGYSEYLRPKSLLNHYSEHPRTVVGSIYIGAPWWVEAEEWQREGYPIEGDGAYREVSYCLLVSGLTWSPSGDDWKDDHEVTVELMSESEVMRFGEGYYLVETPGWYDVRMWWTGEDTHPNKRRGTLILFTFAANGPGRTER